MVPLYNNNMTASALDKNNLNNMSSWTTDPNNFTEMVVTMPFAKIPQTIYIIKYDFQSSR